jgi:predicted ribosomally synthesized peptide with nif11-like leader
MSQEAARKLIERMKTDKEFRDKINSLEDVQERMKLVQESGFDCTLQEIRDIKAEISDSELSAVAGGAKDPDCGDWKYEACWSFWPF